MTLHQPRDSGWTWLAVTVLAHFVAAIAHGVTHVGAQVPLSPLAAVFVFGVILAGPLVGLALSVWGVRTGSVFVAVTMAGSLAFGVVNHFVLAGSDHVAHVAARWQGLFAITAVLVALTEALGLGLAIRLARADGLQGPLLTGHASPSGSRS